MKQNVFSRIIILLFIMFLGIYFTNKSGLSESSVSKQKKLTDEQIMKFEEDVKNGVELDLEDYLPEKKDYSNFVSRGAYKISQVLSNIINDKCKDLWKIIKTLFIS